MGNHEINWEALSKAAWECRENALIFGNTKVGAAVLSKDGMIYHGCNIEHEFRSHDIHAETNAISNMVASGRDHMIAILVVADRRRFTPCGGCMDWIFQIGHSDCLVGFQPSKDGEIKIFKAKELMPFYPK